MTDTDRLRFILENDTFHGYVHVLMDRYEYAFLVAEENGREEPNKDDEFEGFRRMIDCAMNGGDKK